MREHKLYVVLYFALVSALSGEVFDQLFASALLFAHHAILLVSTSTTIYSMRFYAGRKKMRRYINK